MHSATSTAQHGECLYFWLAPLSALWWDWVHLRRMAPEACRWPLRGWAPYSGHPLRDGGTAL